MQLTPLAVTTWTNDTETFVYENKNEKPIHRQHAQQYTTSSIIIMSDVANVHFARQLCAQNQCSVIGQCLRFNLFDIRHFHNCILKNITALINNSNKSIVFFIFTDMMHETDKSYTTLPTIFFLSKMNNDIMETVTICRTRLTAAKIIAGMQHTHCDHSCWLLNIEVVFSVNNNKHISIVLQLYCNVVTST